MVLFFKKLNVALFLLTIASVSQVQAGDYSNSLSANAVLGLHTSNSGKDSEASSAITFNRSYLEQYGYGLNFQYLTAPYSGGGNLDQIQLRASYWKLLTPDHSNFNIVPSADVYIIDNNDTSGGSDNVIAFSLSSAFLRRDNSYSITPSFSYSSYDGKFSVTELDLAMGLTYNDQWASFSYIPSIINVSDKTITGTSSYISHKVVSSHFIKEPKQFYNVSNVSASLTFGDKAFGIDTGLKSLYNLKDTSQYSLSLDVSFVPGKKAQWLTGLGYENFKTNASTTTYGLLYGYVQFVTYW